MIASRPWYLPRVAEVSNRIVFKLKWLKILTPKQIFPRLRIALAQVEVGKNLVKLVKSYFLWMKKKKY